MVKDISADAAYTAGVWTKGIYMGICSWPGNIFSPYFYYIYKRCILITGTLWLFDGYSELRQTRAARVGQLGLLQRYIATPAVAEYMHTGRKKVKTMSGKLSVSRSPAE
ncbi:hypothetical protein CVT25_000150 [Psilocybe cyanescens]|uniref:Uncharacterized protein n=1 Tax=Psilocybe cyanescens TaxID=93625 RepID=A0A409X8V9_PSICY|nr:hypothetical protein CVT25_000150 [Psilocybe cyanescens]